MAACPLLVVKKRRSRSARLVPGGDARAVAATSTFNSRRSSVRGAGADGDRPSSPRSGEAHVRVP